MSDAVNGIVSLFIMMAVGFFLCKLKWFSAEGEALLVKLALKVSVPCALFANALKYLGEGFGSADALSWVVPPLSIAVALAIGILGARALKVSPLQRGLSASVFSMSNTIIIGLPVCTAVFGEGGIPFVILYYAANTVIFWTVGANMIAADGGHKFKFGLSALKRVFSPALIGFLLGLGFTLLKLSLPKAVMSAVTSIGSMNTPLCMFLVGASIAKMKPRELLALSRGGVWALAGRLFVSPAIVISLCAILGMHGLAPRVFTLMAAMPAMNQSVLVAKANGADEALSARLLSATALLMLATVPLYTWLTEIIFL